MREKRTHVDYARDMLEYAEAAERIVDGTTFASFSANEEKTLAVVRALEIVGEAARQIPEELREQYPDVPWSEAIGMRNKVIHGYFGVDMRVIWDTVRDDLPPLRAVARMLADIESR